MIERRSPIPRKGERLVGYRPVPGLPRDAAGRLLLVYQFAIAVDREGAKLKPSPEEARLRDAAADSLREGVSLPPRRSRSPLKIEQGKLL